MYLCAILLSHALNEVGCTLPKKYKSCAIDCGAKDNYFIRAKELRQYLIDIGGEPITYSSMEEI